MGLQPKFSEETKFVEVLASRHARYVAGAPVVDADLVADSELAPGIAFGKHNSNGQYGPVTRDKVAAGGADTTNNEIPLKNLNETDWHNWQVGDNIICDPGGVGETATIQEVDEVNGKLIVDSISTAHSEDVDVQKDDGTSAAEFVATGFLDLADGDALIEAAVKHGAIYKDRMPNYDTGVDSDLAGIEFK